MRYSVIAVLAAAGTTFASVDDGSNFNDDTQPSGYVVSQIADGQIQAPTAPVAYTPAASSAEATAPAGYGTPSAETTPVAATSEAPAPPAYSSEAAPVESSAPAGYGSSSSVIVPVPATSVEATTPVVATTPAAYTPPVESAPYPVAGGNSTLLTATSAATVTSVVGASSTEAGAVGGGASTSSPATATGAASALQVSGGVAALFGAVVAFLA